jgi:rhamnose transport system substrate-binding protein
MQKRRRFLLAAACMGLVLPPARVAGATRVRLVIIPKLVGIDYYDAVKNGIDDAVRELRDVEVVWTGPTQDKVDKQIEIIDDMIAKRPDVIAVAANDPIAIVPALQRAQKAGIHAMSWDADARVREFFVNLVDFEEFGSRLVDAVVRQAGANGDIAVITTTFTAPNQSSWIAAMKQTIVRRHPGLRIVDVRPAGESTEQAYRITQDLLKSEPSLKAIVALGAPNLPGAAQAVRAAGAAGRVAVVGNSTPNLMRKHLKDGTVRSVLLWNAPDHGYLTVHAARQLALGGFTAGQPFDAGRMGPITPRRDEVSMQVALPVLEFTRDNVDQFRF